MNSRKADVIQVVMLDVLRPAFEEWLASRGLELGRIRPSDGKDDLPLYVVSPTDETFEKYREWSGSQPV